MVSLIQHIKYCHNPVNHQPYPDS